MREYRPAMAKVRVQAGDSFSQAVAALMSELPGPRELHGLGQDETPTPRTAGVNLMDKILCC